MGKQKLANTPENPTNFDIPEKWHLIKCGSVSLTDCQRRYATCELEALGIMWACKKSRYYLEGHNGFKILTDHKPLVSMFHQNLDDGTNTRIHNFREKVAHLWFQVEYTKGKHHFIADALSRSPAPGTFDDGEAPTEQLIVRKTVDTFHHIARADHNLEPLFEAAAKDVNYKKLIEAIRSDLSWCDMKKVKEPVHPGQESPGRIGTSWHFWRIRWTHLYSMTRTG